MAPRSLDRLWLALLAATALTWALGEAGWVQGASGWAVVAVFALAFAKGRWIALDFMELRTAPALWRRLVVGWLTVVIGAVLAARWVAGG